MWLLVQSHLISHVINIYNIFYIASHFNHAQTHAHTVHLDWISNNKHRFLSLCLWDAFIVFVCILPWNCKWRLKALLLLMMIRMVKAFHLCTSNKGKKPGTEYHVTDSLTSVISMNYFSFSHIKNIIHIWVSAYYYYYFYYYDVMANPTILLSPARHDRNRDNQT